MLPGETCKGGRNQEGEREEAKQDEILGKALGGQLQPDPMCDSGVRGLVMSPLRVRGQGFHAVRLWKMPGGGEIAVNSQSLPILYPYRPSYSRSQGQWALKAKPHGVEWGNREGRVTQMVCYTAPVPAPVPVSVIFRISLGPEEVEKSCFAPFVSRGLPEAG